eukprot:SAG25_NODE_537_length_7103_cov_96.595231_9_plen_52_part_00
MEHDICIACPTVVCVKLAPVTSQYPFDPWMQPWWYLANFIGCVGVGNNFQI